MSDVIVEREGGVMLLRLNRPDRMNAMGGTLLEELQAAFESGARDDRVRAFVVTGEGRAWCAGADLSSFNERREPSEVPSRRFGQLDPLGGPGRNVLSIYRCGKPTIAAVNGVAVGGGFGLCCAFDIRIASHQARFGTVFIKRALASDYGLSWFLPRLVGPERAAELFYTGRMVEAQEALSLGIVSRVVPHEKLLDEAMAFAGDLAKQPPMALNYARQALQHSQHATLQQQLEFEWPLQLRCLASDEFKEGVAAFLEKREPDFSTF